MNVPRKIAVSPETPAAADRPSDLRSTELPKPKPDLSAYRRERRIALAVSPRRLTNYLRYKLSRRVPSIGHMPIKLDIENVSRCNFACTMCQVSQWPGRKRAEDMAFADFKGLIDAQPGLVEIKIQGMGEPTMQGDDFFRMIRYARSKHIWVRTTTNASLLHLNDNPRKLIDSGVNDVQISVDGSDAAVYDSIRKGGKFDMVRRNCRTINDYCRGRGVVRTQMWVVLQRANIGQFDSFLDCAHEMGFKRLSFALNLNDWGQDHWRDLNSAVTVEDKIEPARAWHMVERGRALGIDVGFWNNTLKYSAKHPDRLCPWPFERAYVSSDMRIVPCCMLGTPEAADLGDARDFAAHWHGESFTSFRRDHLEGRIPRVCEGCDERPAGS